MLEFGLSKNSVDNILFIKSYTNNLPDNVSGSIIYEVNSNDILKLVVKVISGDTLATINSKLNFSLNIDEI